MPRLALPRRDLARHLGIAPRKLSDLLAERSPVTFDLAQRLGAALGSGTRYWLGLQVQHDIWQAKVSEPIMIKPLAWRTHRPAA